METKVSNGIFTEMPSVNEFSPILKRLMLNAEKNLDRLPKQRRHDVLMKKFATSLFILLAHYHTSFFTRICLKHFLHYELSVE